MNIKALEIRLGSRRIGLLFQFAPDAGAMINRFVADEDVARDPNLPIVSLSWRAQSPQEQVVFGRDVYSQAFNGKLAKDGQSWFLPAFFQNLLPEGVFRNQLAWARKCEPNDHFELLAACGKDLPGNIYALPIELSRIELGRLITQNADALEMTVTADPLEDGVSLSGFQPKLGVIKKGERFVGRTKDNDSHIIAKLPGGGHGLRILPESFEPTSLADEKSDKARRRQLSLTPNVLRIFCNALDMPGPAAIKAVSDCVVAAVKHWPGIIEQSRLAQSQKEKLLACFYKHPAVQGVKRRNPSLLKV